MTVLLNNNAVFFHIPKTGGWWVLKVLRSLSLTKLRMGHDHLDYDRALWHDRFYRDAKVFRAILRRSLRLPSALPLVDERAFKFCFVREPAKWYESYWRYMQSLNWKYWGDEYRRDLWHPLSALNGLGSPDFNQFMANVHRVRPGFVTEMFGRFAGAGVVVGKQERLVEDTLRMLTLMNVPFDRDTISAIPKFNESPATQPVPNWDPGILQTTCRLEHAAYVRYGYPVRAEAQYA